MSDINGIFSAKAKAVLQSARMAARNLGSDSITVEHLLLGLVREDSGYAAETLKALKVNLVDLGETIQLAFDKWRPYDDWWGCSWRVSFLYSPYEGCSLQFCQNCKKRR